MKNKKSLEVDEVDTSLSFICKTCLEKFLSLVWPTKSGNCGKEMKKVAKYSTSQEWKELFRGTKNHFSLFWNAFFLQNIKKLEVTSFKFEYSDLY